VNLAGVLFWLMLDLLSLSPKEDATKHQICHALPCPAALEVAYCESRFNPLAYHKNRNKTTDWGLFQINSIWSESYSDLWKRRTGVPENIVMASKIFNIHGDWRYWVCKPG